MRSFSKLLIISVLLLAHSVQTADASDWCKEVEISSGDAAQKDCKDVGCSRCKTCKGGWTSKGWKSATKMKDAKLESDSDYHNFYCLSLLAWLLPLIFGLLLIIGGGIGWYCYKKRKATSP